MNLTVTVTSANWKETGPGNFIDIVNSIPKPLVPSSVSVMEDFFGVSQQGAVISLQAEGSMEDVSAFMVAVSGEVVSAGGKRPLEGMLTKILPHRLFAIQK